jgi:hypothetical protein
VTGPVMRTCQRRAELKRVWLRKTDQRDPYEEEPVRRPARREDRGRRGARWDWVSTAPTREGRGGAPRWREAEEGAEWVRPPAPCPFSCRLGRVPAVCERCASRDVRAPPARLRAGHLEGEDRPEVGLEVGPEVA